MKTTIPTAKGCESQHAVKFACAKLGVSAEYLYIVTWFHNREEYDSLQARTCNLFGEPNDTQLESDFHTPEGEGECEWFLYGLPQGKLMLIYDDFPNRINTEYFLVPAPVLARLGL